MTQDERRIYLIQALLEERDEYQGLSVPAEAGEQKKLLRALMNVRPPRAIDREFLRVQDEYLQEELARETVTGVSELTPVEPGICLWRGDITTLRCDAIVNAANSGMRGCFRALHSCIDNIIHTKSGIQLRLYCDSLMNRQRREEPAGRAKITPAFNLPSRYVLHTVGPMIEGRVTRRDRDRLASCYHSCLTLAAENGLESVAFCCISTGVFRFPSQEAAEIAVRTVRNFLQTPSSIQRVIFNVFRDTDQQIYQRLLGAGAETTP